MHQLRLNSETQLVKTNGVWRVEGREKDTRVDNIFLDYFKKVHYKLIPV